MINPFDISGEIDHLPSNYSQAFEVINSSVSNTGSLLSSNSKLLSSSYLSHSSHFQQLKSKISPKEPQLSMADLASSDTFAISKSSSDDILTSKPPLSTKVLEKVKKIHCETCKCLELSQSKIPKLEASASLQYLSKLESMPKNICTKQIKKPYTSPIYKLPASPSQIFRQRINSHVVQMKLNKQHSEPSLVTMYPNKFYIY